MSRAVIQITYPSQHTKSHYDIISQHRTLPPLFLSATMSAFIPSSFLLPQASTSKKSRFYPSQPLSEKSSTFRRPSHHTPVAVLANQKPIQASSASPQDDSTSIAEVDPRSGLLYLSDEARKRALAKNANKFEKVKNVKCGSAIWTEITELAELVRSGKSKWEDLNLDDFNLRTKWLGFFHRPTATPGKFMIRLRVPNGELTATQLRVCAEILDKFADPGIACADITTRQNLQLRGVKIDDAPEITRMLYDCGLCSVQSGLDNVRNLVGNPLAGIDPMELLDTRPFMIQLNDLITGNRKGNRQLCNLPRKFNISMNSTRDNFAHTHINDLGYEAVQDPKTGQIGFNVIVGGFFSGQRVAMSVDMDTFITQEQVVPFTKALLEVFRDHGDRGTRTKTRFMYLVEALGIEKLRDLIQQQMGVDTQPLARAIPIPPLAHHSHRDIVGVHPQKQPGMYWIGANVPAGRLMTQDLKDMAEVSETFGDASLRLTVAEGLIFPNIPEAKLADVQTHPLFQRFLINPGNLLRGLVSCTGAQFCPVALSHTKLPAIQIVRELEQQLHIPNTVRMHFTGCPNSCGQVQVADIGLMGSPAKLDGKAVEGYQLFLGGEIGDAPTLAEKFEKAVPADKEYLVPKLREILIEKFGATPKTTA